MKSRIIISGFVFLIVLLVGVRAYSQNTVLDIFRTARSYVRVIDSMGIEIEYIDFNVLTSSQNYRETWQSLLSDYGYSVIAFGNENIDKLKVELYEYKGGEWSFLERGKPLSPSEPYASIIDYYLPTADVSGMIKVIADEFASDATNGRYFVVVGKTLTAFSLTSYSRIPVKINTSTLKQTPAGKSEYIDCTFKIYQSYIEQYSGKTLYKEYKITENLTTDDLQKSGIYLYTIQDYYGNYYTLMIDTVNKTIAFYEVTKRQNVFTGWVYTYG